MSGLLRFHGTSPLARKLRRGTEQIRQIVAGAGGTRVRVFGSVATGEDEPGSDVDLLLVMSKPLSLMQLGRLEQQISDVLDDPVIDAICMRLAAGIEVLAKGQVRTARADQRPVLDGDRLGVT